VIMIFKIGRPTGLELFDVINVRSGRTALLPDFGDMWTGALSHGTFSRSFRLLDPTSFARLLGLFLDQLGKACGGALTARVKDASCSRRIEDVET
jgi:hypothetical protein